MKAILGDDYLVKQEAAQKAFGVNQQERDRRAKINATEEKKSFTIYTAILGMVLVGVSIFSVEGTTLTIQISIGMALVIVGAGAFVYLSRKARGLRRALAANA